MRILVVEDDPSVAQILKILLVSHNYAVEIATDGEMGLNLAEAFEYDLILLDILLPKLDGISLCKTLRTRGYRMPILLLTGQGGSYKKVVGLDTGADDYVVKPFDHEELIARIRALLRRGHISSQPILEWGELRLDPSSREATYANHILTLTPKEYALVEMLLRNPRLTFSLSMILEHLWTFEEAPSEDAVRVHMKTLRQKLKAAGAPIDLIETVYGIGYRLNPVKAILPATAPAATPTPKFTASVTEFISKPISESISKPVSESISQPISESISQPVTEPATGSAAESVIQSASEAVTQAEGQSQASASFPAVASEPRIVIVAQDANLRSRLTALLFDQGWQVITLEPPQNWQEMLENCLPHLLILDADLPQAHGQDDGFERCQLIRQSDRWTALPILLITPPGNADRVHQVFAAGASDFVSQPIVGPELLARVQVHLGWAQLQQKIAALESHRSPAPLLPSVSGEPITLSGDLSSQTSNCSQVNKT